MGQRNITLPSNGISNNIAGAPVSQDYYRYGFNGKENDNDVKGTGNQQDYGMRIYDPRLGRFLSVDPLTKEYAELTPYQFASNRPIDGIDLDGKEWRSSGKYFNPDDGKFHQNYNVTISLNYKDNTLHLTTDKAVLTEIENKAESMLANKDASGALHDPIVDVNIDFTEQPGEFNVRFFDLENNMNFNSKTGNITTNTNTTGNSPPYYGKTHFPGNSQANVVEVTTSTTFSTSSDGRVIRSDQKVRSTDEIARTLGHELGHTVGLKHPWDAKRDANDVNNTPALFPLPSHAAASQVLNNLMNSEGNPVPHLLPMPPNAQQAGTSLLPQQRAKIDQTVSDQQKK